MAVVSLITIRELLLPRVQEISRGQDLAKILAESFLETQEIYAANILESGIFVPQKPYIITRELTLPEAVLVGAAAVVINNPVVTRRFWQGWFSAD